jgi:hypothetical protein
MRVMGRMSGKMSGNKHFLAGFIDGLDPEAVAEAINENDGFMGNVMAHLDPGAIAGSMTEGLQLASEVMKNISDSLRKVEEHRKERLDEQHTRG